ncbi:MAG: hypothetical protein J6W79_02690 [Alphaproteobacteria bacterium]|nr:hypothetical protein [Alphaproteobacteria bacterium]
MKKILLLPILLLAACNSVYVKPNTMDKSQVIYASRGGYAMRRSIKEALEQRGYNVVVGKMKSNTYIGGENEDSDVERNEVPTNVRYVVKVAERREKFNPFWCPLNGFWWWNFNVSIADQKTGDEIMTWRGRGCANSSLRKLNTILDELEKSKDSK